MGKLGKPKMSCTEEYANPYTSFGNSVERHLKELFSFYYSCSQALPQRRQNFLRKLSESDNEYDRRITDKLFEAAFKTNGWSAYYHGGIDLGAHKRSYGWQAATTENQNIWYEGFINLLKVRLLESNTNEFRERGRKLLSESFQGLWVHAGCYDILEVIIQEQVAKSSWIDMWLSVKNTLNYGKDQLPPDSIQRLNDLEKTTSPKSDFCLKIEAYVLTSTQNHIEFRVRDNGEELFKEYSDRARNLGIKAIIERECLKLLSPKIWKSDSNLLKPFGEGLAQGCESKEEALTFLIDLLKREKPKASNITINLFQGFVSAVYHDDSDLAHRLLVKSTPKTGHIFR